MMGKTPRYLTGDKEGIKEFLDRYDVCSSTISVPFASTHRNLPSSSVFVDHDFHASRASSDSR